MTGKKKIAVVLFNLGGPDSMSAVQPFLFNLFNDKAIIGAPRPIRYLLAKLISARRAPVAEEIYKILGGKSPLLENTEAQAKALEKDLAKTTNVKVFIAMRYWHPFSWEAAEKVKAFAPDHIVLLPLYPQFSTTTTASSISNWNESAKKAGIKTKTSSICCYPTHRDLIQAHVLKIKPALLRTLKKGPTRILFTAHGLPEKIVAAGDPYAWQVEQTVLKVFEALKNDRDLKNKSFEHVVCYQSRVGPLKWIGPATEDEIKQGGKDGKNLVVVPIAFVSEHSETLVELDIEYADLAREAGVKEYARVGTLDTEKLFIKGLSDMVVSALDREGVSSFEGRRICPGTFSKCPCGN